MTRGGGRHFSRDLDPRYSAEQNNNESSSEEEESSDEEDEEDVTAKLAPEMAALNLKLGNTVAIDEDNDGEMSRAERKALKKKQGEEAAKKKAAAAPVEEESEDELPDPYARREPSRRERYVVVARLYMDRAEQSFFIAKRLRRRPLLSATPSSRLPARPPRPRATLRVSRRSARSARLPLPPVSPSRRVSIAAAKSGKVGAVLTRIHRGRS